MIAALRELFVPVHITALNTQQCMRDPRDAAILRANIRDDTDDFDGGEREAFVLPDGTMQRVFLSLHGYECGENEGRCSHYTAAGRRDEEVTRVFRANGAIALRAVHGELPQRWRELWDDGDPAVAAIAQEPPRWPVPAPGHAEFRVFVHNSYRMYDALHGQQLAAPMPADVASWLAPLAGGEPRAELPQAAFVQLAQAMVPRGMVDTELAVTSIDGALALVVEREHDGIVEGRVEGRFALLPKSEAEVGKRFNAACLFRSEGALRGRFTFARAGRRLLSLRAVATDVAFEWLPDGGPDATGFAPWHRIGIEWVCTPL